MMKVQEVLAILVCLSLAANVADWLVTRRGSLLLAPRSGRLRYVFGAWSVLLALLAALALLRVISVVWLIIVGAAWMLCSQTRAIFLRHTGARIKS
jgi:hypothetical protein